jgi:hypothetical protein
MPVAPLQYPRALSSANQNKSYPTFKSVIIEKPNFSVAYVMAALLGCVFGVALAVYSESGFSAAVLFNSETATNNAAQVIGHETTIAGKDFPLVSQTVKEENPAPDSLLTVAVYKSAALESTSLTPRVWSAAHRHRATRKASARFRRSLRHRTNRFRNIPVVNAMHQAAETAETEVAVAARPASFMIEGDVTVADYDALAGLIETHEGKTFTVAKVTDESNGISWADSMASVHYRCDQSGSCTLFHAGLSVPNVRMST